MLAELVGSLQRLLDRYDTAVLLANLPPAGPAGGHTPGSCAGGDAGAGAGPAGGQEADVGREPRWPVLYVNNAWTALTGGRAWGLGVQRMKISGPATRDVILLGTHCCGVARSTQACKRPRGKRAANEGECD